MQRMILAVLIAFLLALAAGPSLISMLTRLRFGQPIRTDGPKSHFVKKGTPTMGGLLIIGAMIVSAFIFTPGLGRWNFVLMTALAMLGYALLGFFDDYTKVKQGHSLGVRPWHKLVVQFILAFMFSLWLYLNPLVGSKLIVPFLKTEWDLGWFYVPFTMFVMVAMTNSANLLDGLDGLLGGCGSVGLASIGLLAMFAANNFSSVEYSENLVGAAVMGGAGAGACLGFLRFNSHPAKVIMGDTGSMAVGAAMMMIAMQLRLTLFLPLIAIMLVVSSVTDIIQFISFRVRRKRVFRMAPLHHHYELGGVPETKIVAVYIIITIMSCLVAFLAIG